MRKVDVKCPKCDKRDVRVKDQLNQISKCRVCGWSGPTKDTHFKKEG